MADQFNIAGFATTTKCGEITIKQTPALDFHLTFIDTLADLLNESREPKITVSLFKPKDSPKLGVVIIPNDISDLTQVESKKTFLFRLDLMTSETVVSRAYSELLNLVSICVNVLRVIQLRLRLTLTVKLNIINSNELTLLLTVSKQV